jgi:hypothetical protein
LESPSNRSVFNILEEHTYLDEFSPEDAGFEDWDDLSEEDKDYYYQEWKEEFYQGAFERFKEKCMKHLDDFIEYLQKDSDENFAGGGEVSEEEIDDFVFEYGVSRKEAEETLKRRKGRLSHKENLRLKELSTKNRNVGLTLTDSEEIEFDKLVHKYRGWDYIMADGGEAGKKGKLNATYIPKRNIKTLTTTYGNTIKGKDLLDGAYTTRKDIRQDPKMVRTMFEEEEFAEFKNGGEAKKRRRRANTQTGRTDRSVDKTRVGKPVGYRFSNSLASKLRKDQYAVPTEKQITKYLGKGIYKENRKNRSDRDRTAKL